MDGTKFDAISQRLAAAATRRRIVGGVLGGAALLTGAALAGLDADAKKGKGKAKGKGKGKNNGGGNGKGKAHGKNKVAICHKTDDNGFQFKRVPTPALKGHSKHGDVVCGEAGVCQTGEATACDQTTGACTFANAADDTPCVTDVILDGICQGGVCVDNPAT